MVLANEATKILIEKFPALKDTEDWKDYYLIINPEEDPAKIHPLLTVLGRYVENELNKTFSTENLKDIFLLIEFFLNEGEPSVQSAASTCFLENLINYTAWGDLKPDQFIHYLGQKSKKFCKKWDEFTGVATPGLWEKGEFKGQRDPVDGWL
jgi:hypothetical protein